MDKVEFRKQMEKARKITENYMKEMSEASIDPFVQAELSLRVSVTQLALSYGSIKKGAGAAMTVVSEIAIDMLEGLMENPIGPDGRDFPLEEVAALRKLQEGGTLEATPSADTSSTSAFKKGFVN